MAASLSLGSSCLGPEPNGIQRAANDRETERLRRVREEQQRDQLTLTLAIAEDREALRQLRDAAAEAAQRRREGKRALDAETAALAALQAQLASTREQAALAARELEAMRAVLAEAQTKELRIRALQEQSAQLDAQIAAAQRDAESKSATLLPQLTALQERVKALVALEAQLVDLLTPPAALPAAQPANAPQVPPATDATGK